jgi:hypothetical protein
MLRRIKEEVFAYTQRLSSSYFENTLSGKIAHRAIMLPDQILLWFRGHRHLFFGQPTRGA